MEHDLKQSAIKLLQACSESASGQMILSWNPEEGGTLPCTPDGAVDSRAIMDLLAKKRGIPPEHVDELMKAVSSGTFLFLSGVPDDPDDFPGKQGKTTAIANLPRQSADVSVEVTLDKKVLEKMAGMSWEQAQRTKPASERPGGERKVG